MRTRKSFLSRKKYLDDDYSQYNSYYAQLAQFVMAHRGKFLSENRKIKRDTKQINNHAKLALRTLQSGLMAGITSPARPWFKLAIADRDLMDYKPVKHWLAITEITMREVFSQSNLYNNLHTLYGELGNFGICPLGIFEDFDNVIHTQAYTAGSYRVASDEKGVINVFYREYELTVDQMMKKWGKDKLSDKVNDLFNKGHTEHRRKILHCIEPNDGRDHMSMLSSNMPFRSVYIELDEKNENADIRIMSGFEENPIVCPRWDVIGEETYSNACPAMDALGDTKALQLGERRSAQATDFQVKPVLQAPQTFAKYKSAGGIFAGDLLIGDDPTGKGVRPVHDSGSFQLGDHERKLGQIENRISKAFYEDLFRMISNDTRSNVTAREIDERHEEKLLLLGPVLQRLHNELLDPLIKRTFNIMLRAGILPPPPEELDVRSMTVNYISILAQAQRLSTVTDINQFLGFVGDVSQLYPEARHKVDINKAIDSVGNAMSIDPDIIVDTQEATEKAGAEAQQQQAQTAMASMPDMAQAAKTASEIDPQAELLQQLTGAAQ